MERLTYLDRNIQPFSDSKFTSENPTEDELLLWVQKQQRRLKINKDKPKLGLFALSLKFLEIDNTDILFKLEKMINEDKFIASFEEIVNLMDGFQEFKQLLIEFETISLTIHKKSKKLDSKQIQAIEDKCHKRSRILFKKLEFNMLLSISDIRMDYYERIANFLVATDSPNRISYSSVENHIVSNIGMNYDKNVIFSIFCSFAKSGYGSLEFFQKIDLILFKVSQNEPLSFIKTFSYNFFSNVD